LVVASADLNSTQTPPTHRLNQSSHHRQSESWPQSVTQASYHGINPDQADFDIGTFSDFNSRPLPGPDSQSLSYSSSPSTTRSRGANVDCHSKAARDFRCGVCNQGFRSSSSRNVHEMRHGSKRVFEHLCAELGCGRRFDSKGHLNKHMNRVSLILNF
jgi:hypothetical protein